MALGRAWSTCKNAARRRSACSCSRHQKDSRYPTNSRFVFADMMPLCGQPEKRGFCLHVRFGAFAALISVLITSACSDPHAVLKFTTPSTVTAGSPFTVTVTVTVGGNRDTIVNSVISFTSSDPAATLPAQYQFTPTDAGSHTWTNGFTLKTLGDQTISASIYDASGINGTASVTVSP